MSVEAAVVDRAAKVNIWMECEVSCARPAAHLPYWFHLELDVHLVLWKS